MSRARYSSRVVSTEAGDVIQIIDLYDDASPTMSVTNDAETVVEEVVKRFGDHRIICRDTDGQWDELIHAGGVFAGFRPITCDTIASSVDTEVL